MSKALLEGLDAADQARVKVLASEFITGQIARGEIANTPEAIKGAVPGAVMDARKVVCAVGEFLCG